MSRDCLNREDFQVAVDIYLDLDKRSFIKQELFALSYFRGIYSSFHLVRIAEELPMYIKIKRVFRFFVQF